jgi:oligopeptide/dipeptide ABC transporter ATP-binding protein
MYLGRIVEMTDKQSLFEMPLHPYTEALLSAVPIPRASARERKRVILTGDVPSPVNPPPGCRFHTRCWLYERLGRPEVCRTEEPLLRVIQPDHHAACHFAEDSLRSDVGVAHLDSELDTTAGGAAVAAT